MCTKMSGKVEQVLQSGTYFVTKLSSVTNRDNFYCTVGRELKSGVVITKQNGTTDRNILNFDATYILYCSYSR